MKEPSKKNNKMREIKFRFWDARSDEWCDSENWLPSDVRFDVNETFELALKDGIVVQQYTGLKDKNGVEIYEGDTLRSYRKRPRANSEYCLGDYWMEDGSDPFEEVVELFTIVSHETQFFERKYQDGHDGLLNGSDFNTCEVIGNIFEGVDK